MNALLQKNTYALKLIKDRSRMLFNIVVFFIVDNDDRHFFLIIEWKGIRSTSWTSWLYWALSGIVARKQKSVLSFDRCLLFSWYIWSQSKHYQRGWCLYCVILLPKKGMFACQHSHRDWPYWLKTLTAKSKSQIDCLSSMTLSLIFLV